MLIMPTPITSAFRIEKKQFTKFAKDFAHVYNKAWAGHGGLKELKKDQVMLMFNKMKPVMDETHYLVYLS